MQEYDKKEAWRSSQGRMRSETVQNQKEGQRHLTGYAPRESERIQRNAPKEVARMGSSFGDVAVGVDGQNKMTYAVSQRRSDSGTATKFDEKVVRGDGIHTVSGTKNMVHTNPHDRRESAVLFKDSGDKAPSFMRKRFASMMQRKDLSPVEEHLSFLDVEQEKKREKALLWQEKTARATGESAQAQQLANQRITLAQVVTEKETQARRFQQLLAKGQDAARAGEGKTWESLSIQHNGEQVQEEIAEEDEEDESLGDEQQ